MKVIDFEIENFMTHRYTKIDCTEFQAAIILGHEKNNPRKSMGVGKSTIFYSFEYVFFNEAPFSLDKVVRKGADKCKITTTFEVATGRYRVMRARTKKGKADLRLYQFVSDNWEDLTQKTAKETEAELAKIIGISHGAFKAAILFSQADLHGLASVSPKERKAMLKEPLQILIYNDFEKLAKKKSSAASKVVDKTKILIDSLGDPASEVTKLQEELESVKKTLIDTQSQKTLLTVELDAKKLRLAELTSTNPPDAAVVKSSLESLRLEKSKLVSKIQQLKTSIQQDEAKLTANANDISKFTVLLQTLESDKEKIFAKEIRDKIAVKEEIGKLTEKEIEGSSYIKSLSNDKLKLSQEIPDQDLCELCKQPVSKDHRENCEAKRQADLVTCLSNLEKYQGVLSKVRSKKAALEIELSSIDSHDKTKQNIEAAVLQKKNELDQATAMSGPLTETLNSRKSELANQESGLTDILSREKIFLSKIELIESSSNKSIVDGVSQEITKLSFDVKSIEQKITSNEVQIGVVNQKIHTKLLDIDKKNQLESELKIQEKHYSLCLKAQYVFSPSGIPTWIINTILDDLQIKSNQILAQIRPEMELSFSVVKTKGDGNLEDTLDINYRINGEEYEYAQLSGGQKVVIALTLRRAMSSVIQHRIGIDIKLLNLDEVDMQFDAEMIDSFIDIIRKWQDELTIFVISHNEYVKTKFKHSILIESDGINGSCGRLVHN